jgi:hypothetical protein
MRLDTISFVLAGFMAEASLAHPFASSPDGDLVVTHAQAAGDHGALVYYGVPSSVKSRRTLENELHIEKRGWFGNNPPATCNTDQEPVCDDKNGAPNELCGTLVDELYAYADRRINKEDRSMCYVGDAGGRCCLRWTKEIDNLYYTNLADHAAQSKQLSRLPFLVYTT